MPVPRLFSLLTLGVAFAAVGSHAFVVPRSVYQARHVVDASQLLPTYDYIIVGGGTSGLTVADRLTEDPDTTVLVLEAGSMPIAEDVLPVTGGGTQRQAAYIYVSVPQQNLGGQIFPVILGKMVGGGSGINAMMSARGSAEDYDRWGNLFRKHNKHGWNWQGLLPYFKKVRSRLMARESHQKKSSPSESCTKVNIQAFSFNPPPADIVEEFDVKYDASYWGTESALDVSFPSYQYPGLRKYYF